MLRIDRRTDSLLFFFFTNIEELYRYYVNHKWKMLCSNIPGEQFKFNRRGTIRDLYKMTPKWNPPTPHSYCDPIHDLHVLTSLGSTPWTHRSIPPPQCDSQKSLQRQRLHEYTGKGLHFWGWTSPVLFCIATSSYSSTHVCSPLVEQKSSPRKKSLLGSRTIN